MSSSYRNVYSSETNFSWLIFIRKYTSCSSFFSPLSRNSRREKTVLSTSPSCLNSLIFSFSIPKNLCSIKYLSQRLSTLQKCRHPLRPPWPQRTPLWDCRIFQYRWFCQFIAKFNPSAEWLRHFAQVPPCFQVFWEQFLRARAGAGLRGALRAMME